MVRQRWQGHCDASRLGRVVATVNNVASFYDAFPYPTVTALSHPMPIGFKRGAMDFLLRRRAHDRLPRTAKIWVAGCGTQQACHWATVFPEGQVFATDISEGSLERAADLAKQLDLSNVDFERLDLMTCGDDPRIAAADFDLVVSTGVVHHLPEPERGLRNIRTALKPSGAALLMVYSRMHREPLATFRTAFEALAAGETDHDKRYALMSQLLDEWLASERCSPPARGAFEILQQQQQTDRPFVADCLLHPLEYSYDIDGLLGLLDAADFRHTSWTRPSLWRLDAYLDSAELSARFATLDPVDQWRTAYCIAGHAGPLLEVLVEPKGAEERAPYGVDELLSLPLTCRLEHQAVKVDRGKVTERGTIATFEKSGGQLSGTAGSPFGGQAPWALPDYAEGFLRAFDGTRPAGAVVGDHADEFGAEALLELIATLSPLDVGMLAPNW